MAAGYLNTVQFVLRLITAGDPFTVAWSKLIDFASGGKNTKFWKTVRGLDIESDLRCLDAWLSKVVADEPPSAKIRGLRFGLFHPDVHGAISCDLYLSGSTQFDEEGVWGYCCSYHPGQASPYSAVLHAICRAGCRFRKEDAGLVCLWFAMLAVAEIGRCSADVLLGKAPRRGMGVGFDSGDLIPVGILTKTGFHPANPNWPVRTSSPRKRTRLPKGEYFRIEGGVDVVLCVDGKSADDVVWPHDAFQTSHPKIEGSLTAKTHPDWPNQSGNYGSLDPYSCDFIIATIANKIGEAFSGEVEFLPLSINGRSEEWRIFKTMPWVECLDREESNRQQRVTLRRQGSAGHHVFYVKGCYEGRAIFVSRPAAELMIREGILGANFIPVDLVP